MTIEITYKTSVVEDLEAIDNQTWESIENKINEVCEKGTSHPDLKIVPKPSLERPIYQLNLDLSGDQYRVFLDFHSEKITVLAVWGFDFTHSGEVHWEELQERI
jgi:mRNA-degrading endonuclease RelE of RelBE toxin-antitoxin system